MKRLILSLIFLSFLLQAYPQKVYFIYIQTEAEQPFFVKMNDKIYSSTGAGYIILSNLRDSTHTFSIGFPEMKGTEHKFSVRMNSRDHGYLFKNFGEKGWGLFDLQSLAVQMAMVGEQKKETIILNDDVSKFTAILAKAVDDSTLLQKQLPPKAEEKKIGTVSQTVDKKEDIKDVVQVSQPMKEETKKLTPDQKKETKDSTIITQQKEPLKIESYKQSIVTRRSESSTSEGFGMTFIDKYENGVVDTIVILIPDLKSAVKEIKSEPFEEKKFLDITNVSSVISKADSTQSFKNTENKPEKTLYKNNCPVIANETDFLELRRKMATAMNDEDMIVEAAKYYKSKCFYTGQIKNLSVLFLNDEGKYRFFDLSYKFVADVENFESLQREMKDEYYINRFKSMFRQ